LKNQRRSRSQSRREAEKRGESEEARRPGNYLSLPPLRET